MWLIVFALSVLTFLVTPLPLIASARFNVESLSYSFKAFFILPFWGKGVLSGGEKSKVKFKETAKKAAELVYVNKIESTLVLPFEEVSIESVFGAVYGLMIDTLFAFMERTHKEGVYRKDTVIDEKSPPTLKVFARASIFGYELVALIITFAAENLFWKKEKENG